jgi:hypothetical protein
VCYELVPGATGNLEVSDLAVFLLRTTRFALTSLRRVLTGTHLTFRTLPRSSRPLPLASVARRGYSADSDLPPLSLTMSLPTPSVPLEACLNLHDFERVAEQTLKPKVRWLPFLLASESLALIQMSRPVFRAGPVRFSLSASYSEALHRQLVPYRLRFFCG